jgi:hypothetical protein
MYAAVYHFGPRWTTRIELTAVPQPAVEAAVGEVKARSDKDAEVRVAVTKQYTATPPTATPGVAPEKVPVSDVQVTVVAPPGALKESEFAELDAKIKQQDMTLKQIRDYRPLPPTNLRVQ